MPINALRMVQIEVRPVAATDLADIALNLSCAAMNCRSDIETRLGNEST